MLDAPATPSETDRAAWKLAALRRQAERVEQLSEAGLRLALSIERRVSEHASDAALTSEALAKEGMTFSRVSRAVRMSVLLHARLLRDIEETPEDRQAEAERLADEEARLDPAYAHKARVEAIIERVAKAQFNGERADDEDRLDRLVIEAGERLDDEDIYGDVAARPVGELVSLICRDLGLDPDWERLSREAWAQAEIADGAEGSPFLSPFPPDGGRGGDGGDPAAALRLNRHPPSRPLPLQGGEQSATHPFRPACVHVPEDGVSSAP